MAKNKLSVSNKIVRYNDTLFQASQIASVELLSLKKEKKITLTSLRPLRYTLPVIFISFFPDKIFFLSWFNKGIKNGLLFLGSFLVIYSCCLLRKRRNEEKQDKFHTTFGISLHMSGGDVQVFISDDKQLKDKIMNALSEAMNKRDEVETVDILNIEDTKVELSDVEHFKEMEKSAKK